MEVTNSLLVWRLSSNAGSGICGIGDPCLLLQKTWFFFWLVIITWSWRHEITGNDQDPTHKLRAWGCCHNGWRSQPHIPCQTNHLFFTLLHLWCSTSTRNSTSTNPFINLIHWVKANRSITPQRHQSFALTLHTPLPFQFHVPVVLWEHWMWSLKMSVSFWEFCFLFHNERISRLITLYIDTHILLLIMLFIFFSCTYIRF